MPNDTCIFCEIVAGRAEANVVADTDRVLAFMDIRPVTTGHLLVIPKQHWPSLAELDPDSGSEVFRVAQRMAAALYASGLPCEGVNLFLADGTAAGQEVFHSHLHVLPRFEGDGFGLRADFKHPSRDELAETAERIRVVL